MIQTLKRRKTMGIASLVLGIIAIVIGVFSSGLLGWLGAILAIVGIILGALGRKDPEKKGIATAGLVCSIIGLVLCLILYLACAACVGGLAALS
jgi:hypothetical protein